MDDLVIAFFEDQNAADAAVERLRAGGFDMTNLSAGSKGFRMEEKVVGFHNGGDRIQNWGGRGAAYAACRSAACS